MPDAVPHPVLHVETAALSKFGSNSQPKSPLPPVAMSPSSPGGFEILLVTPLGPYRLPSYVHYLERTKEYTEWMARKPVALDAMTIPSDTNLGITSTSRAPRGDSGSIFRFFNQRKKKSGVPEPLPLQIEKTSQSVANFMDKIGMKEAVKQRTKVVTPSRLSRIVDGTKTLVNPLLNRRNSGKKQPGDSSVKTVVSGRHFPTGTKILMLRKDEDAAYDASTISS